MPAATVLIATPSAVNRSRLAKLVGELPGYEVIATAGDLSETFNAAEIREPDIVIIAEEFGTLPEFAVMQVLFDALGARWIALGTGAAPAGGLGGAGPGGGASGALRLHMAMAPEEVAGILRSAPLAPRADRHRAGRAVAVEPAAVAYDKLVVIGASTGGVDALLTVLSAFPADCPPTAIVQHTGRGFASSLVQVLDRRCAARVVPAQDGLVLSRGMVCVAGGSEGHLTLSGGEVLRCQVRPGPAISGHAPSVDVLFRSAMAFAPRVVGAILTGMGQDGAAGLLELHRAGCVTLGQDEATSVVYGMPKAAFERGAVQVQLPIQRIGAELLRIADASFALQSDRRRAAR
jgi:two-component system, chemotaxis family, protein-glutamate methylesterase/glutaminase